MEAARQKVSYADGVAVGHRPLPGCRISMTSDADTSLSTCHSFAGSLAPIRTPTITFHISGDGRSFAGSIRSSTMDGVLNWFMRLIANRVLAVSAPFGPELR